VALKAEMARKTLPIGKLSRLVGYHLRRASTIFALDFRDAVQGTGMRQVLVGVLAVVQANPNINQGMVGTLLGIKRANMVSLINELVELELLERTVPPTDRRAFSLTLTPAGDAMLEKCMRMIALHESRLLAPLSPTERQTLLDLLARIDAGAH